MGTRRIRCFPRRGPRRPSAALLPPPPSPPRSPTTYLLEPAAPPSLLAGVSSRAYTHPHDHPPLPSPSFRVVIYKREKKREIPFGVPPRLRFPASSILRKGESLSLGSRAICREGSLEGGRCSPRSLPLLFRRDRIEPVATRSVRGHASSREVRRILSSAFTPECQNAALVASCTGWSWRGGREEGGVRASLSFGWLEHNIGR